MPKELSDRITEGPTITERNGSEMVILTETRDDETKRSELWPKNMPVQKRAGIDHPEVKPVEGYDNRFLVTEDARVISKSTNKVLKSQESKSGYEVIATKIGGRDGTNVMIRVHRVVAGAFVPNPENKPTVNHKDGVKMHNHRTNLEWATHQENTEHAFENGLAEPKRGCDGTLAKLNEDNVRELRALKGSITAREASERFGIAHSGIVNIWNNKTYVDIK